MTSHLLRHLLVVLAVGQVVSPSLVFLLGSDALTSGGTETPITPPGWTFTMWGLVCLLSLAYAGYQVVRRDPALESVLDALARPLAVVFALYSVWLALAELNLVWLTVVVFFAMLAGLLGAGRIVQRSAALARRRPLRLLVAWLLGTYAGWTSVAVFINLSAALRQSGAPTVSASGLAWQGGLLVAAVALAAVVTVRWQGSWPYVLTVVWALVGAATSTFQRDAGPLTVICGVGIAAVLTVAVLTRRGRSLVPPGRLGPAEGVTT